MDIQAEVELTPEAPVIIDEQPTEEVETVEETEEVVEAAEPEVAESAPAEAEAETVESTGEVEKPKKSKVERRIDRLTKEKRQAEERAEQLEKENQELKGVDHNAPPSEDQFDTYEAYTEALSDWKADQKYAKRRAEEHQKAVEQAQLAAQQQLNAQLDVGRAKHDDFDYVALRPPMEGGPAVTQSMLDAMQESPIMADIAYHLGKNTDEAAKIAGMSPIGQIRAITQLEARLIAPPAPKKKITKAPAPIKPVGTSATVTKSVNDMTDEEYAEWRRGGR